MNRKDFNTTISVNTTAGDAFKKIAQVDSWWAKDFTGKAEKLNDTFTIRFGDTFVDFKITEVIPKEKITWYVTNSFLPWLKDKTEWNNTKVVFELASTNNQLKIDFTHVGLVPEVECYDQCEKGWTRFVTVSLLKFLTEGKGLPE